MFLILEYVITRNIFSEWLLLTNTLLLVCKDGYYGVKCTEMCGACIGNVCNQLTGNCPDGCTDNWTGKNCDGMYLFIRSF